MASTTVVYDQHIVLFSHIEFCFSHCWETLPALFQEIQKLFALFLPCPPVLAKHEMLSRILAPVRTVVQYTVRYTWN